jgi:hypothetical protein
MLRLVCLALLTIGFAAPASARQCARPAAICPQPAQTGMVLISRGDPVPVITDGQLDAGALRAVRDLHDDLDHVAGRTRQVLDKPVLHAPAAVIVGTLGRSPIIDRLVREKRLDISGVAGGWEAYLQQVVDHPAAGIGQALVIAGSDKRGTIFGAYDLSRRIGVSPWTWWADVPVRRAANLWVLPGRRVERPAVRYRGIFINDEEPALGSWAREKFGGVNHLFYEHLFELILRLRGNYLWPAMWGKSFYEDDPENARLANEMGVIIGTSHHEPMMRAQVDWDRHGKGPWDYTQNAERLRQFWHEGMERTQGDERLVTVGMRGNGDMPMTQGTAIGLLERIVADQRRIIADVTRRPPAQTPQVWALYKEVQDYYDKGMRAPDDVTLLFSDDNWGNIRRLPRPGAKRAGGYGIYYHFDYVGGPRNYKWINTTQIERVWEQMHLAAAYGADRLWIVNVGDLKPLEFPTSFFLDYAWAPAECGLDCLAQYPSRWAAEQFGEEHASEIGELLTRYSQYNARRKPELIGPETFSLETGEADRVVADWKALAAKAEAIGPTLPLNAQDAYFELVLYPILASANLNDLYVTVARNRLDAAQGRSAANALAERARTLFERHGELRRRYEASANGKWSHMMSQAVIGYTGWQQPDHEVMPEVRTVSTPAPSAADVPKMSPLEPVPTGAHGFIESNGVVAVEAAHATPVNANGIAWQTIPNLGLTGSAVTAFPVTAPAQQPGRGPRLEFSIYLRGAGDVDVQTVLSPTLDYLNRGGMRYAVSIDDGELVTVNVNGHVANDDWSKAVADNRWIRTARLHVDRPGAHLVKLWLVDPGLIFQRLEISRGPLPPSYLGPPESVRR